MNIYSCNKNIDMVREKYLNIQYQTNIYICFYWILRISHVCIWLDKDMGTYFSYLYPRMYLYLHKDMDIVNFISNAYPVRLHLYWELCIHVKCRQIYDVNLPCYLGLQLQCENITLHIILCNLKCLEKIWMFLH